MNTTPILTNSPFVFHVIPFGKSVPKNARFQAFLNQDGWDDWGKYCTQFFLTIVDADGMVHEIGNVKIGQFDLKPHKGAADLKSGYRWPKVASEFESLDETFFSLGQSPEYYENLAKLGDSVREVVLNSLRDVAFDSRLWAKAKDEYVMIESLLRFETVTTVEGQYRRMAQGGARLTSYSFSFTPPKRLGDGEPPFNLAFRVKPESRPPTNIHVLIGRNGVGKTTLLALMTNALVASRSSASQSGSFSWKKFDDQTNNFANLVAVSFSAFDDTELFSRMSTQNGELKYSYIGLHRIVQAGASLSKPKSPKMLANEFVKSLANCQAESRKRRWKLALSDLMSDSVFRSASLETLIDYDLKIEEQKSEVLNTFKLLSSGHKIVLLTLTRLVETVEEKTLVLVDEIEAHLHPPLLSAFIRALSSLLVNRNGVSIIATHSPVVLQEVPQSCVWVLTRHKAERPSIETFGENLGILSREVFQLELSESGFQKLLKEAVLSNTSYESALDYFNGQLSSEARAVMQAMFLEKERDRNN
jgi:hypothetical protein